ncbi:zinc ribbon domain-containing protein [Curvibacter sp. HBC61]|uniref:Zinc ribbon domain-containing protein n=1 Tax=Curvibacter cyanobacteriorum TaxID=3026422 RepID=A0ABT5MZ17_9BURK|nr:FmdB family zinc ribbon protein [Curvibacter sp. HBC61]MDD0839260.1 zinc ribbon domain-containing protein [Curvibacter sp. HBC61]
MPIYAYKCESCGHSKDVLQKISDAPLTDCPACGAASFRKQITAAGFQLKGSGWYVTDFRGGSGGATAPAVGTGAAAGAEASAPASAPASDSASSASADASPTASAGGCGGGCACH